MDDDIGNWIPGPEGKAHGMLLQHDLAETKQPIQPGCDRDRGYIQMPDGSIERVQGYPEMDYARVCVGHGHRRKNHQNAIRFCSSFGKTVAKTPTRPKTTQSIIHSELGQSKGQLQTEPQTIHKHITSNSRSCKPQTCPHCGMSYFDYSVHIRICPKQSPLTIRHGLQIGGVHKTLIHGKPSGKKQS